MQDKEEMGGGSERGVQLLRAAVCRGDGRWIPEDISIDGPNDDEVLVRLAASGVCRTDVELCESGAADAAIFGHEGAGVVEELGGDVTGVEVGDHVIYDFEDINQAVADMEEGETVKPVLRMR